MLIAIPLSGAASTYEEWVDCEEVGGEKKILSGWVILELHHTVSP